MNRKGNGSGAPMVLKALMVGGGGSVILSLILIAGVTELARRQILEKSGVDHAGVLVLVIAGAWAAWVSDACTGGKRLWLQLLSGGAYVTVAGIGGILLFGSRGDDLVRLAIPVLGGCLGTALVSSRTGEKGKRRGRVDRRWKKVVQNTQRGNL